MRMLSARNTSRFCKFIPQNDLLTVGDIYNMIVKKPFSEEQFIREIDVTETDAGLISPSFQLKKTKVLSDNMHTKNI